MSESKGIIGLNGYRDYKLGEKKIVALELFKEIANKIYKEVKKYDQV